MSLPIMVPLILQSKVSILGLLRQCLPKSQSITLCPSSLPSRNPRGIVITFLLHISLSSSLNNLQLLQNLTRPVAACQVDPPLHAEDTARIKKIVPVLPAPLQ